MKDFFEDRPPSHLSDEERAKWYADKKRYDRSINRWVAFIIFCIGLALVGATLLHAELVYGDWRCAFAECRIVKMEKQ